MDRLTMRVESGDYSLDKIAFINPDDIDGMYNLQDIAWSGDYDHLCKIANRLAAYEDTGLTPEEIHGLCEMDKRSRMAQMLRWEQAEAEGRLIVLPCKVGDTVYVTFARGTRPYVVDRICIIANENVMVRMRYMVNETLRLSSNEFGETVFLTRELAEEALNEQKKL